MAGDSLTKLMEDFRQFRESEKVNTADRYDFEQEPVFKEWDAESREFKFYPLHEGQKKVWHSKSHETAAIAGAQSGKTIIGPWWVLREIQRKGGGDALIVGPSYPTMNRRLVPECCKVWENELRMGEYKDGRKQFVFNKRGLAMLGVNEATVWFGFAEDPETLESMKAVCAWLDEAGQSKFSTEANEAINRRLSLAQGRKLYTTTPYAFNWFKTDVHDKFYQEPGSGIEVVHYLSVDNPFFSKEEWDRQKILLPDWKFKMMYCGIFTRPAGAVYDCFDRKLHTCKRFPVPNHWQRAQGTDFGPVHTAGVWLARDPEDGTWYLYSSYLQGGLTPEEHVLNFRQRCAVKDGEKVDPWAWGGAPSEDEWRAKFAAAGFAISKPPIRDLNAGIECVYKMLKTRQLVIFDDLEHFLAELESYSYEIDDDGTPNQAKIENKAKYHRLDGLRYVAVAVSTDEEPVKESGFKKFLRDIHGEDGEESPSLVLGTAFRGEREVVREKRRRSRRVSAPFRRGEPSQRGRFNP